ncbi:hypothetical protein [Clavibacter sp. CFBP 8614]|uniref:hypothetical protein n=1 Tax=unclassified Clavibacter TaxID=2626594 RepID=UPI0040415CF5
MPYDQSSADFNESTYGMYLTTEMQRWLSDQDDLDGVALIIDQNKEALVGYDASIPRRWGMLYLQFKMPKYLRRSNASEYAAFGQSYFRFRVKTDATINGNVQHNVLCELEGTGAAVFYAAPSFLRSDELIDYALHDGMYVNSVFPRPQDLGTVAVNSLHSFAYTSAQDIRACSEPGPRFAANVESMRKVVKSTLESADMLPLEQFLPGAYRNLISKTGHTDVGDVVDHAVVAGRLALEGQSIGLQAFLFWRE